MLHLKHIASLIAKLETTEEKIEAVKYFSEPTEEPCSLSDNS
jgi:hypothetical protein